MLDVKKSSSSCIFSFAKKYVQNFSEIIAKIIAEEFSEIVFFFFLLFTFMYKNELRNMYGFYN